MTRDKRQQLKKELETINEIYIFGEKATGLSDKKVSAIFNGLAERYQIGLMDVYKIWDETFIAQLAEYEGRKE